jgi:hypothetical protein
MKKLTLILIALFAVMGTSNAQLFRFGKPKPTPTPVPKAEAELNVGEVQKKADQLREWGVIQQAEAHKFIERYNNAVKRYHRLKIIAAVIASLGGVLLGVQFMALTPPPYNLFIPVVFSGVFAALVWFLL